MRKNIWNKYLSIALCSFVAIQLTGCGATADFSANPNINHAATAEKADTDAGYSPSYEEASGAVSEAATYEEPEEYMMDDEAYRDPTNTESYATLTENDFIKAQSEKFSTFSIDVDTASYSNVRRYIDSYSLPPADAVRTEEFINYFKYDYPQPENDLPFSITQEVGDCPWNMDHKLLLLGLQGKDLDPDEVSPSNLVFLLDVSGSMDEPNKLPLLKKSFSILTSKLKASDSVSIVTYAGNTQIVLDGAPGNDYDTINNALNSLYASGGTAGASGIKLAYDLAQSHFIHNGNNRIILATDGDFNIGPSSNDELLRLIRTQRDNGIYMTALGLGMGNYKDDMLEMIADNGNGNYFYIDTLKEANKVFNEQLSGTLFTIAKDVKIQVEFNPSEVEAYRLIGYENRLLNKEDFDDDTVDAGEIGAGHTVTALYEIIPASSAYHDDLLKYYEDTDVQIGDEYGLVKLRYKAPDSEVSKLITAPFSPKLTLSKNNLLFASSVAEYCMLLKGSSYVENGSYDHVLKMLKQLKGDDDYKNEFYELVETTSFLCE